MSVHELLLERAGEYEIRAASLSERAGLLSPEAASDLQQSAVGFALVAIALREVCVALVDGDDECV